MKNYTVYKRHLCAAALFLFILFSAFGTANASWDGTTTTPVSPDKNVYKIHTAEQLAWVAKEVNDSAAGTSPFTGSTVALMNDIDLSKPDGGKNLWTPIGLYAEKGVAFDGTFDGQGYSVANMTVSSDAYCDAGFFGYVSGDVEIKNLTVIGSVRNTSPGKDGWSVSAGCVAGCALNAVFKNCRAVGNVTIESASSATAGLVFGGFDGGCRAENITASGDVTSTVLPNTKEPEWYGYDDQQHYIGGIIGLASGSALVNCECSAAINITTMESTAEHRIEAALICARFYYTSVENARASGSIALGGVGAEYIYAGGVAGTAWYSGEIYNCVTDVKISYKYISSDTQPCIGGTVGQTLGYGDGVSVKNTFSAGGCETPTDKAYIGGVCGYGYGGSFENCASAFAAGKYGLVAFRIDPTVTNCGWLDTSAENSFGNGYGTAENVASFDAEAMASKIVVAALPQEMRLDMTVGASAEAKLITYPAKGGTGLQNVALALPAEPAGLASIIYEAANSFKVTALSVGNGLLSFSAKLLPTLFDGDFNKTADAVTLSPALSMNVRSFALTPTTAAITVGSTTELTVSGEYAASGVTWSVTGNAVTLDKTSGLVVTATGVKAGTATVTATTADGATATATITVTEKGSSSGCSTGFGGMAMLCALALLPLACGRRKK
ncbi:Ig-like domain-containing protein [Cloacibacillus evryensis]